MEKIKIQEIIFFIYKFLLKIVYSNLYYSWFIIYDNFKDIILIIKTVDKNKKIQDNIQENKKRWKKIK